MENEEKVEVTVEEPTSIDLEQSVYDDVMNDVWGEDETSTESEEGSSDQSEVNDNTGDSEESEEGGREEEEDHFSLKVKHLDDPERNLNRAEATEYAQKGLDYDRIHGKLENANSRLAVLEEEHNFLESIRGDFPNIKALMIDTKKQIYVSQGMSDAEAQTKAEKDFENIPVPEKIPTAEEERENKRKKSFTTMAELFPDLDPQKDITPEMWKSLEKTDNLAVSYLLEKNKELQSKLSDYELKEKNSKRSTGSMQSKGKNKSGGYASILDEVFK